MTDLHAAPDITRGDFDTADTAPTGLRRFRGSTLDDALAAAKLDLGDGIEIVEANRIRRGGLGGFFATDLGIEVIVAGPNPTTSTTRTSSPEFPTAVDRVLRRFDAQGGDRFVPSGDDAGPAEDIDAPVRDPHPFATRLARELHSNGLTEDLDLADSPRLDSTVDLWAPRLDSTVDLWAPDLEEAPAAAEPSGLSAELPDPVCNDTVTGSQPVEAGPIDDALADIDQLLLRAGISLPGDTVTIAPAEPAPDGAESAVSTALALPTSELLTTTADRLANQLAAVDPHAAGTARTLKKIKLKISSLDGTSVEMTAEWSDDE